MSVLRDVVLVTVQAFTDMATSARTELVTGAAGAIGAALETHPWHPQPQHTQLPPSSDVRGGADVRGDVAKGGIHDSGRAPGLWARVPRILASDVAPVTFPAQARLELKLPQPKRRLE